MGRIEQSGGMSGGRTYPREWFGVSSYGEIKAMTFIAETEHKLREPDSRGSKRYTNKRSDYRNWYPTREEAEIALDEVKARTAACFAQNARARNAAPELVEALRELVSIQDIMDDEGVCDGDYVEPRIEAARALLARIDGEGA